MKEFINFVAQSLVNEPSVVKIKEHHLQNEYKLELYVPSQEIGKVIGKHGVMADSLRTMCQLYSTTVVKKSVSFRILENKPA